nr:MAG TPA: hypothetical protein [Caudoviricetes sp.]
MGKNLRIYSKKFFMAFNLDGYWVYDVTENDYYFR